MIAGEKQRVLLGPGKEFDRIREILRELPELPADVRVGPGDDASVLSNGTVVSTDLATEGVHFRLDWVSRAEAGYRSAAAAVSDLAAMAAEPVGILVSMGVPGDGTAADELMKGVRALASKLGMAILGGDLTRSSGPIVLDVVSIGRVSLPLLRSGARPGDELWVTGTLGAAAAAAALWSKGSQVPDALRERFVSPSPRIAEARWLSEAGVHAGLDVSDGLAGDAGHLAAASEVAVVLDAETIPFDPGLAELTIAQVGTSLEFALHGGDDFEMFVSAPPGLLQPHEEEFRERFAISLTRVGRVTEGRGVWLESASESAKPIDRVGYDHFSGAVNP